MESTRSGLEFKHFKEYGNGQKKTVLIEKPGQSVINPSLQDMEDYEQFKEIEKKQERQENVGVGFAMNRNRPVNLTKLQKKVEKCIERGTQKASKVTAPGSSFMSQIYQGHQQCQMCAPREAIISDLKKQRDQTDKRNEMLEQKIRLLEQQNAQLQKKVEEQGQAIKLRASIVKSAIKEHTNPQIPSSNSNPSIYICLDDSESIEIRMSKEDASKIKQKSHILSSISSEGLKQKVDDLTDMSQIISQNNNANAIFSTSIQSMDETNEELKSSLT